MSHKNTMTAEKSSFYRLQSASQMQQTLKCKLYVDEA